MCACSTDEITSETTVFTDGARGDTNSEHTRSGFGASHSRLPVAHFSGDARALGGVAGVRACVRVCTCVIVFSLCFTLFCDSRSQRCERTRVELARVDNARQITKASKMQQHTRAIVCVLAAMCVIVVPACNACFCDRAQRSHVYLGSRFVFSFVFVLVVVHCALVCLGSTLLKSAAGYNYGTLGSAVTLFYCCFVVVCCVVFVFVCYFVL